MIQANLARSVDELSSVVPLGAGAVLQLEGEGGEWVDLPRA
jgi:hypothetical protein